METSITTKQPDYLVKLECPSCGAIARMSDIALRLSGGVTCSRDNLALVRVPRRQYTRRNGDA